MVLYGSTLIEHNPTSLKGGPKSIKERKTFMVEKYIYMNLKGVRKRGPKKGSEKGVQKKGRKLAWEY